MDYLKYKDGVITYPYTVGQLLSDNFFISFPFDEDGNLVLSEEDLATYHTYKVVQPNNVPSTDPWLERLVEVDPVLVNGVWTRQYVVSNIPTQELNENKLALINKVKQIRDFKTEHGGFYVNGKWYHSNVFSRTQQMGLTMIGQNVPPGLMWKTMDGSFVEMTPALASSIFLSAVSQDTVLFAYAESLINQINSSSNPNTINLDAGWPATFNNV